MSNRDDGWLPVSSEQLSEYQETGEDAGLALAIIGVLWLFCLGVAVEANGTDGYPLTEAVVDATVILVAGTIVIVSGGIALMLAWHAVTTAAGWVIIEIIPRVRRWIDRDE